MPCTGYLLIRKFFRSFEKKLFLAFPPLKLCLPHYYPYTDHLHHLPSSRGFRTGISSYLVSQVDNCLGFNEIPHNCLIVFITPNKMSQS